MRAMVADKLTLHGIEFRTLSQPLKSSAVEVFRASKAAPAPARPSKVAASSALKVIGASETRDVGAGLAVRSDLSS